MKRIDYLLLFLLTLLAFFLRFYRLGLPAEVVFDEVYYVEAGKSYLEHKPDPNLYHPPLAKMLIALGMKLGKSGGESFSWRLSSLVFGTLMVPLSYLLGMALSGKTWVSALSAFFLCLDFLHLVQSRIAMLDISSAFFALAGFLFLWLYLYRAEHKARNFLLFSLGFGLSIACKWNGFWGALAGIICLFVLPRAEKKPVSETLGFIGLMLLIYSLAYLPWIFWGKSPWTIINYHYKMLHFRYLEEFKHGYLSYFWQWATLIRPIWYYYQEKNKLVYGIIAMGSPLFWWSFLILLPALIYQAVKQKHTALQFILIAYLTQYLGWAAAVKGAFFYYMLSCVPWMALAMGMFIYDYLKEGVLIQKITALLLIFGVVLFFILYYPLLTALPVSKAYYSRLIFFRSWI